MAGRTWEEEYERQQSRLRDSLPRCEHRAEDGARCPRAGYYEYRGYFPLVNAGRYCAEHRKQHPVR